MYDRAEQHIAENLKSDIEFELARVGLLFRVFARAKSQQSMNSKIALKNYGPGENDKKMQDLYGVRIALYFPDDSTLAQKLLKSKYEFDIESSTIDLPTDATFGPTRCNLIFKLPENLACTSSILREDGRIDRTFEVQFRTVFSEGWHEIEHDLRYKCQDDWQTHKDLNRALNGFIATLETCDWAIVKLFDDLAWRHYKAKEWLPMLRTKFRLRWQYQSLSEDIQQLFNKNNNLAKAIFRVDRQELLSRLVSMRIDLPVTPTNIVLICNYLYVKSEKLNVVTPKPVLEELKSQQY